MNREGRGTERGVYSAFPRNRTEHGLIGTELRCWFVMLGSRGGIADCHPVSSIFSNGMFEPRTRNNSRRQRREKQDSGTRILDLGWTLEFELKKLHCIALWTENARRVQLWKFPLRGVGSDISEGRDQISSDARQEAPLDGTIDYYSFFLESWSWMKFNKPSHIMAWRCNAVQMEVECLPIFQSTDNRDV
jgi:hypothetical protein